MRFLSCLLLLLAGCTSDVPRDVSYYMDHAGERAEVLAACGDDPGRRALESNCVNAREARLKLSLRSQIVPKVD